MSLGERRRGEEFTDEQLKLALVHCGVDFVTLESFSGVSFSLHGELPPKVMRVTESCSRPLLIS